MFPKAEVIVHELEAAFWLDRAPQPGDSERSRNTAEAQRRVMAPYRDRIRRIKDGEVLPGITAMLRPGHTPGHTNWLIQSGGERLLLWGDIVHLAAVQVPRPDASADIRHRSRYGARHAAAGARMGRPRAPCRSPARICRFRALARIERDGAGFQFRAEM